MSEIELPIWATWLDAPFAADGFPVRHRVLFGGRGGGKSRTVAAKLVLRAMLEPHRILCLREFQNSLADSSKKLIEDTIERLGIGPNGTRFFEITDRAIKGRNGSVFLFLGLTGREAGIKSLEGVTLVWVEEASTVSQASIDALIPTIRAPGSEIWWTFNPRHPTDPVGAMFRGPNGPPPGTVMVELTWRDNPWFPDVLRTEKEYDEGRDPDKYAHVWEGAYLRRSHAAIFNNYNVMAFDSPADALFRFGADWGFSVDPTVLVRCFVGRWSGEPGSSEVIADPKGNCLFIDYEAYRVGCQIDDTPALFAGNDTGSIEPRWPNSFGFPGVPGAAGGKIYADGARPETIAYMKMRGFVIEAAPKGSGSVEDGISALLSYDIYVHPRARHTIGELTHYSWKVDRHTGAILNKPADVDNHVIDALRYAVRGIKQEGALDLRWASTGLRESWVGGQDFVNELRPRGAPHPWFGHFRPPASFGDY